MHFKTLLLFVVLFSIALSTSAQMVWNPQWPNDKSEVLEYSSSKRDSMDNLVSYFDTAHFYVRVKLTGENEFFYFLEWKFSGFYEDTSLSPDNSGKMVYIAMQHFMMQSAVKVRIEKSNFDVIILNRDKLDSLQQIISARVAESYPVLRTSPDAQLEEIVNTWVSLKADEKIYGLINEFYSIYTVKGVTPNIRHDLRDDDKRILNDSTLAQIRTAYNEFYVLDDKDPQLYKWRYESKIDWGKMPENVKAAILKKPVLARDFADVVTDISINKPDKLVTYFHTRFDNVNTPGIRAREVFEETVKKLK